MAEAVDGTTEHVTHFMQRQIFETSLHNDHLSSSNGALRSQRRQ